MTSNDRVRLTYKEFTDKMNECLHQDPSHGDMEFLCDKDGYELVAPDIGAEQDHL